MVCVIYYSHRILINQNPNQEDYIMNIGLGQKIKELRKIKGLTQEGLAEKLNMSGQAISKWETGDSYPDMELIPVIANFFGVSLDTLFNYDAAQVEKKVDEIIAEAGKFFWGDPYKNESLIKAGLKEYPTNEKLLRELLSLYECQMRSNKCMTERLDDAVSIANQLIAETKEVFNVCSAKADLASIYLMNDRYDDAKTLIDSLPYMWPYMLNDRMRCSSYSLKGEDKLKEAKTWKIIEQQELFIACSMEGEGFFEIGEYKNALKSFTECRDVIERFLIGDTLCYDAYLIGGTAANHMACYLHIAGCHLKLDNIDECRAAIEQAYYVVSHGSGDGFKNDPELYMKEFRRIYTEYGLDFLEPCKW